MSQATISTAPHPDAQLALTMLIRYVHRIAASEAARVASGDATPQQACATIIQRGTSLAVTAHYFGADDIADAIAEVVDHEAARINPAWRDTARPSATIGASA
ncbi:hypothetical protein LGM57_33805 [Burkholderia cepacia]|uniref:hypothetical protein n=1 Tax=Burkholderia cepacia TaxID=292 RepID=UPI001CF4B872|nr:hypothetical protein [Burkholderia cepacia]MCA7981311.1 hypothetical protein [Burkholderia cepacia]